MVLKGGDGMRVLLAEDEKRMAAALVALLKQEKYDVDHVSDGEAALVALESGVYDIAVLDVMMPEMNGFDVARHARHSGVKTPILMLTAKSQLDDKVEGLDSGADDYLTKPFSVEELLARLRATQRRLAVMKAGTASAGDPVFVNGPLRIAYAAGLVQLGGEDLHLTPIEYKLLCLMAANVGKVLTHGFITQKVWGSSWDNDIASLRVFMATLRKKLESAPDSPQFIQTHIGIGYRMLKVE